MTLNDSKTLRDQKQPVEEITRLVTTRTNFGGERYRFACPSCGRRCAMLQLPSGELYFLCRLCYNVTYESCNEGKRYNALLGLLAAGSGYTPAQMKETLKWMLKKAKK